MNHKKIGSFPFVPPPVRYALPPQFQNTISTGISPKSEMKGEGLNHSEKAGRISSLFLTQIEKIFDNLFAYLIFRVTAVILAAPLSGQISFSPPAKQSKLSMMRSHNFVGVGL